MYSLESDYMFLYENVPHFEVHIPGSCEWERCKAKSKRQKSKLKKIRHANFTPSNLYNLELKLERIYFNSRCCCNEALPTTEWNGKQQSCFSVSNTCIYSKRMLCETHVSIARVLAYAV